MILTRSRRRRTLTRRNPSARLHVVTPYGAPRVPVAWLTYRPTLIIVRPSRGDSSACPPFSSDAVSSARVRGSRERVRHVRCLETSGAVAKTLQLPPRVVCVEDVVVLIAGLAVTDLVSLVT